VIDVLAMDLDGGGGVVGNIGLLWESWLYSGSKIPAFGDRPLTGRKVNIKENSDPRARTSHQAREALRLSASTTASN